MDTVIVGNAIEGDAVAGSSRKPLVPKGLTLCRGIRCYEYQARFNVKSKIDIPLSSAPVFDPCAAVDMATEISCDAAIAYSLDKKPTSKVAMGSGTHQTNHWRFADHTCVKIVTAHQELINAIQKRMSKNNETKLPPSLK